ncbi:LuxR C-terminal-related transcriptional regulator [Flavobacterium faecale]|uniref:LuxR C-terminal-related transcriptional regulator n=1 Tax=Flavobacterium faecale TaxID=1355330 RepID=UPI003AB0C25A
MKKEDNKLKNVWEAENKTACRLTEIPEINFNELVSSLVSLGPFYFYVIDFFDMSLSHVSPSIKDIHGFDPETVTFDDILKTIHPDDMDFVASAERANLRFLYNIIGAENIVNYKASYSFRSRFKNGEYGMLNHQAIVLTADENGGFGKSLNIHTNIDHLTKKNSHTFSLIGLKDNPSFTDINVAFESDEFTSFSKREIEIIKLISEGLTTTQIAEIFNISEHTVKTHRKNINKKSDCKNASELINKCISQGLI